MSLIDRKQNIRHNSYFEAYPLMKLFPVALHWLKAKRSAGLAASLQALVSVFIMGVLLAGAPARADTVTYIYSDFSGSPLAATDESGNLLWRESYYAYGQKTQWQPAADEQSQWFHGKEQDADTGMQYFGARYYDPSIGRFLGIDPVDYKDGNLHSFNRYAYGNNNPIKFRDPDGAYAEAALEAVSLAVGLDSLGKNYIAGNYGAAAVDALGVTVDSILAAVPIAPGIAGLGIKFVREGSEVATTAVVNWKSSKQFGHTFSEHGEGVKNTKRLVDRARGKNTPQGQWLDNQKAAEILNGVKVDGVAAIKIPDGLGQVIKPDGTIGAAEWALVVPRADGIKTSFPILKTK